MLEFRVLGPVTVSENGRPVPLSAAKPTIVLAGLLVRAGEVVGVEQLTRWLWDGAEPRNAKAAIQNYVLRARKAIGDDDVIRTERRGYRAVVEPNTLDLNVFTELTGVGTQALARNELRLAETNFAAALGLWRGPALSDVDSSALRRDEASALDEKRLRTEENWVKVKLALDEAADTLPLLTSLAAEHPLRERVHEHLMLALHRTGRTPEALSTYRRIAAGLAEELGLDPGEPLRELHQRLLAGTESSPGSVMIMPLGAPRQLPPDIGGFTGRDAELTELRALAAAAEPESTVIATVAGTPGVGKTSLAIHFAHQVADLFPDGQIYLNLRGHGTAEPIEPMVALHALLQSVGVAGDRLPDQLDARSALWRSHTAGRTLLVVLDDARDSEQVRPLLPGVGGFTVVTSRAPLRALATSAGARRITLEPLDTDIAVELLASVVGRSTVAAQPQEARDIVELCARLPLAIRILGERAESSRAGLAELAAELSQARDRLVLFDLGDGEDTNLRAVFLRSYRALDEDTARLFRLAGRVPGTYLAPLSTAALLGTDAATARDLLDRLADTHLMSRRGYGRFELHALMREFAADLSRVTDLADDVHAAWNRVLDWYLHTATAAAVVLNPNRVVDPVPNPPEHIRPGAFTSYQQALDWYDSMHATLIAVCDFASAAGFTRHAWQLPWVMVTYHHAHFQFESWVGSLGRALAVCEREGDQVGEALILAVLGVPYAQRGQFDIAIGFHERGAAACQAIGDREREITALTNLSVCLGNVGRHTEAEEVGTRALAVAVGLASPMRLAIASRALGRISLATGRLDQARARLRSALAGARQVSYADLEALILRDLGRLHTETGEYADGVAVLEGSIALHTDLDMTCDAAMTSIDLGDLHLSAGNLTAARAEWERALSTFVELAHPSAIDVSLRLSALPPA